MYTHTSSIYQLWQRVHNLCFNNTFNTQHGVPGTRWYTSTRGAEGECAPRGKDRERKRKRGGGGRGKEGGREVEGGWLREIVLIDLNHIKMWRAFWKDRFKWFNQLMRRHIVSKYLSKNSNDISQLAVRCVLSGSSTTIKNAMRCVGRWNIFGHLILIKFVNLECSRGASSVIFPNLIQSYSYKCTHPLAHSVVFVFAGRIRHTKSAQKTNARTFALSNLSNLIKFYANRKVDGPRLWIYCTAGGADSILLCSARRLPPLSTIEFEILFAVMFIERMRIAIRDHQSDYKLSMWLLLVHVCVCLCVCVCVFAWPNQVRAIFRERRIDSISSEFLVSE